MKRRARQLAHHEKYCETRDRKLESASKEIDWGVVGQCNGGKIADGGAPYDRSRQTLHWLMTSHSHALVKKKIVKETGGNATCVFEKIEAQWHVMSTYKHGTVQKRYAKRSQKMMNKLAAAAGHHQGARLAV